MPETSNTTNSIEATQARRRKVGAQILALLSEDLPWKEWPERMREELIGQEAIRFVEESYGDE